MLFSADVGAFITMVSPYTHLLSECMLLGKATSHMAPKEDAEGKMFVLATMALSCSLFWKVFVFE